MWRRISWKANENAGKMRIFSRWSWHHLELCSRFRLADRGTKRILISLLILLRFDPCNHVDTHSYVFKGVVCFPGYLSALLFTCNGVNERVYATSWQRSCLILGLSKVSWSVDRRSWRQRSRGNELGTVPWEWGGSAISFTFTFQSVVMSHVNSAWDCSESIVGYDNIVKVSAAGDCSFMDVHLRNFVNAFDFTAS